MNGSPERLAEILITLGCLCLAVSCFGSTFLWFLIPGVVLVGAGVRLRVRSRL